MLTDQSGNTIARLGKAGIKRALEDPVNVTIDGPKDHAMVWDDDTEVYIVREGKGKRSYTLTVIWWDDDDEKSEEFEYKDREEAMELFIKTVKRKRK